MTSAEQSEASSSKNKSGIYGLLHEENTNPGVLATTLHYLSDYKRTFGFWDKWVEIKCPDGTTGRILKDPADAFKYYAKEWTTKFEFVLKLLNEDQVTVKPEIQNKIVKIFENMNYVNGAIQEMYKNTYLTFAANPCLLSSQKEKQKMDRILSAISLSLIGLKVMLEGGEADKYEKVNQQLLKLIDKLTEMIMLQ
jgi:hypothetical protein